VNILSTLEIRSGSQGFILTIAHIKGSKKPFYFNTDDLEVIRKGLELRHVTVDNTFSIDDRRVSHSPDRLCA
jgi:hypothetical protein